jgi:ribosomal protein S18 acetylase RimI-like enzyme
MSEQQLEEAFYRAWPAAHVEAREGLYLRASGGASRRANSAATFATPPASNFATLVACVEEFYGQRGLPPCIQFGPTSPPGFEAYVAGLGWAIASPASVYAADIATLELAPSRGVEATVASAPTTDWAYIEVERGRFAAIGDVFLGSLRRLAPRAGYLLARVGGVPAAAGLAIVDGSLVTLAAMRTLEEHRRRGAARALLGAAAGWATSQGATTLALQVERDNGNALALYRGAGFRFRYDYGFRVAKVRASLP